MSHYHRFYHIGPYNASASAIFKYLGPGTLTFHIQSTSTLPLSVLASEENSIFKIPLGYTATIEICEVATGPGNEGRYTFRCELHPSVLTDSMGKLGSGEATQDLPDLEPIGECTALGCSSSTVCAPGTHGECNSGLLECVDDEPS